MRSIAGLISAIGVGAAASAASAAPFYAILVDSGTFPGTLGAPIRPSAGTFYQDPQGDNYPPSISDAVLYPTLAFDSFVALGPPPTATSFSHAPALAVNASEGGGLFFPSLHKPSTQLAGVWATYGKYATPNARSGPTPIGKEGVFVARLTVRQGAHLTGSKVFVAAVTDSAKYTMLFASAAIDGLSVADKSAPGSEVLVLRSYLLTTTMIPGFGAADVYDLYMVWDDSAASASRANQFNSKLQQQPKQQKQQPTPKKTIPKGKKAELPRPALRGFPDSIMLAGGDSSTPPAPGSPLQTRDVCFLSRPGVGAAGDGTGANHPSWCLSPPSSHLAPPPSAPAEGARA